MKNVVNFLIPSPTLTYDFGFSFPPDLLQLVSRVSVTDHVTDTPVISKTTLL